MVGETDEKRSQELTITWPLVYPFRVDIFLISSSMERNVGDEGEFLNGSVATRAVNIDPDMDKVKRLDIFHSRYQWLLYYWGGIAATLLLVGGALCAFHHPVWGGILLALSLPVLFIALQLPQTLRGDAYRNGLLIPGIITSLEPLTITCLADVRTGAEESAEAPGVAWGVRQVVIKQLTVQPERLGEQVPCVSLFGATSQDEAYYVAFEPRPLAWGTDSAALIEQARKAIDDDEWLLLPPLAIAYATSEKNEDEIAFFDEQLRPVAPAKPAKEGK